MKIKFQYTNSDGVSREHEFDTLTRIVSYRGYSVPFSNCARALQSKCVAALTEHRMKETNQSGRALMMGD